MAEEIQTSEEEEVTDEETQTSEESEAETEGGEGTTSEGDVDYKEKFSQSTTENQRILEENKALQEKLDEEKKDKAKLEEEHNKHFNNLQEEDPEEYRISQMEKSVKETQRTLLEQKEESDLNSFINDKPEAKSIKEALRKLGRTEPNRSYDELYTENFEKPFEKFQKEKEGKKKVQPETGKGSISKDPVAELGEGFDKLSLDKRKDQFKKMGL